MTRARDAYIERMMVSGMELRVRKAVWRARDAPLLVCPPLSDSSAPGWSLHGTDTATSDALRAAGVLASVPFPTRREATRAAEAILDRRLSFERQRPSYEVVGAPYVIVRVGRRWKVHRTYADDGAGRLEVLFQVGEAPTRTEATAIVVDRLERG